MATRIKVMTPAELGFPNGATAQEILQRLRELGMEPATVEELEQLWGEPFPKEISHLHWDAQAQAWELRDEPAEWDRQHICTVRSF